MSDIPSLMAIGIAGFTATNVDDVFVLIMLFFSISSMTYPVKQVVIGQYIGIGLLVAISVSGYFLSMVFPSFVIGLLGIVPIAIGIRKLFALFTNKKESNSNQAGEGRKKKNLAFAAVASVTFSNGVIILVSIPHCLQNTILQAKFLCLQQVLWQ